MKHVMIWVWRVPGVTQQMLGEVISVELACSNPLGSGYLVYKQLEGGRKQDHLEDSPYCSCVSSHFTHKIPG